MTSDELVLLVEDIVSSITISDLLSEQAVHFNGPYTLDEDSQAILVRFVAGDRPTAPSGGGASTLARLARDVDRDPSLGREYKNPLAGQLQGVTLPEAEDDIEPIVPSDGGASLAEAGLDGITLIG
jgi:hypothetical protein